MVTPGFSPLVDPGQLAYVSDMASLDRIRTVLDRDPTPLDLPGASRAAVAAILDRDLDLLFMSRAIVPGDPWSGHISFPGGREEPQDADLLHTAVRETHEELGLDLTRAEVLGSLDEVTTVSGLPPMVVRPWVFLVDELGDLRPNREVAAVHTVNLQTLLDDVGRKPYPFDYRGHEVTLARVDDPFPGDRFLWGMTLRMVDGLLDRLDGRGIGLARIR